MYRSKQLYVYNIYVCINFYFYLSSSKQNAFKNAFYVMSQAQSHFTG